MYFVKSVMNCFHGFGDLAAFRSRMCIVLWLQALPSPVLQTHLYPVMIEILVFFLPARGSLLHLPIPVGSCLDDRMRELQVTTADVRVPPVI